MSTIKIKIPQGLVYKCTGCENLVKEKYFIHQCIQKKHILCYQCLKMKKICKKCKHKYTLLIKTKQEDVYFY